MHSLSLWAFFLFWNMSLSFTAQWDRTRLWMHSKVSLLLPAFSWYLVPSVATASWKCNIKTHCTFLGSKGSLFKFSFKRCYVENSKKIICPSHMDLKRNLLMQLLRETCGKRANCEIRQYSAILFKNDLFFLKSYLNGLCSCIFCKWDSWMLRA